MFTQDSGILWAGFVPFCFCSIYGLRWLIRGLRGDIFDSSGGAMASRGWFVAGGLLAQLPLAAYTYFVWRQGLFSS